MTDEPKLIHMYEAVCRHPDCPYVVPPSTDSRLMGGYMVMHHEFTGHTDWRVTSTLQRIDH